jgi:hypothetical protein
LLASLMKFDSATMDGFGGLQLARRPEGVCLVKAFPPVVQAQRDVEHVDDGPLDFSDPGFAFVGDSLTGSELFVVHIAPITAANDGMAVVTVSPPVVVAEDAVAGMLLRVGGEAESVGSTAASASAAFSHGPSSTYGPLAASGLPLAQALCPAAVLEAGVAPRVRVSYCPSPPPPSPFRPPPPHCPARACLRGTFATM